MTAFRMVTLQCDERGCDEYIELPVLTLRRARVAAAVQGWKSTGRGDQVQRDFCPAHARRKVSVPTRGHETEGQS